jgi:hypothetical protein
MRVSAIVGYDLTGSSAVDKLLGAHAALSALYSVTLRMKGPGVVLCG